MNDIKFCKRNEYEAQGYIAVLDGYKCQSSAEFLQAIWAELKFPGICNYKWTAYSDWMRDLEWITETDITIVIQNYNAFLSHEPENKEYFISNLRKIIFPYWENDTLKASGTDIKNITVICENEPNFASGINPTANVANIFSEKALNGQKTPHSVSMPVIREENGNLFLSAFVFFYNREQFQSAMIKRPGMWILADFVTGEIVARYSCQDKEFSSASYERLYNISVDQLPDLPQGYWKSTYAILDEVRSEYASTHVFNNDLYNQYLKKVLDSTPAEYRIFYEELSLISTKEEISMTENNNTPLEEITEPQQPTTETPAPTEQEELFTKLDAIQQSLVALQQTFDDKIAEDAHKNSLFDNMHRELIRYQNGALDKIVDTIALDIIQLVDSTKGHVRVYEKKEPTEENYKKLLRIVKGISEDLEDILYRQNIESYRVPGHEVDTRRQKIIQTIPTDDQSKNNLVAVRAADGYEKGDKVLRPERIKIFKYEAAPENSSEN